MQGNMVVRLLRFLALAAALSGCGPAHVGTVAPKDAAFTVGCATGCGKDGRAPSLTINVNFGGTYARQFSICNEQRPALIARLMVVQDLGCSGLEVPSATIGGLAIGTTTSELNGKVAATLDAGEGFVAFQCEGWLPELLEKLERTTCSLSTR